MVSLGFILSKWKQKPNKLFKIFITKHNDSRYSTAVVPKLRSQHKFK